MNISTSIASTLPFLICACSPTASSVQEPALAGVSNQREAAVSLGVLKQRSEYAGLDKPAVEALARQSEAHWAEEFSGFTYQRVERFAAGGLSHWMSIWSHDKTGLEFVLVPGGTFQMGSPASEKGRKDDEVQHWVTLDPFLIARAECTQKAWAKVAGAAGVDAAPSLFKGSDLIPVSSVGLDDVNIWCRAAGLQLPTEAQWEFSCRGGTTTTWAMGDNKDDLRQFANLGSADCPQYWIDHEIGITESWHDGFGNELATAGSFDPNAFGLFNVHGNVREWCRDGFIDYEVQVEKGTGFRPGSSRSSVARGGSFNGTARIARSAQRDRTEGQVHRHYGFRPSLDLPFWR